MIEKFSDEELKQIMKELGIIKKDKIEKSSACGKHKSELHRLWAEKVNILSENNDVLFGLLYKIIDITLCNFETKSQYRLNKSTNERYKKEYTGFNSTIGVDDLDEYCQMYQEILEIIKKHNRKWEGDTVEQQE